MEVEVLMKRMVELQQQQEEEECTQEEMVTRFERERSESIPTGKQIPVYHVQHTVIHLADICLLTTSSWLFVFSGGAGSTAGTGSASGGGSRVQIWGLCPQRRAGTAHHESPGSLEPSLIFLDTNTRVFSHFYRACCLSTVCTKFHWPVCVCLTCAGLLMGGPRLLSGQQITARHGSAPGWKIPGTLTFNLG